MKKPKSSLEMGIDASPTKTFFVDMLTKDIELEDAILDLLDNCIDGIQRSIGSKKVADMPYQGFWARINFSADKFTIEDNCGGIPLEVAKTYAFRMGRPASINEKDLNINTIGTYGIGMKRAIFKMGHSSQVVSQTQDDSFRVVISPAWVNSDEWKLPFENVDRSMSSNGTIIQITDIRDGLKEEFAAADSTLSTSLSGKISCHYSYIIKKGFTVFVNDQEVLPSSFDLLWEGADKIADANKNAIAPYLYQSTYDGVSIELAVGFYRQMATASEVAKGKRTSSENAGWTIICNDRVVVYRDKTRLTGWGEAGVPNYHPQFISIVGTVHFRSNEPRKLPITTTKRGLDVSSDLYLYTKDFMREGLKIFTSYTNKWKDNVSQDKKIMKKTQHVDPNLIFGTVSTAAWTKTKKKTGDRSVNVVDEKYYKPSLPVPPKVSTIEEEKSIKFSRKTEEVKIVGDYLFGDEEWEVNEVGDRCFELMLKAAQDAMNRSPTSLRSRTSIH
jgi:Histidine kinase-, DNA gyrase B-, and HSP90-like ATPase